MYGVGKWASMHLIVKVVFASKSVDYLQHVVLKQHTAVCKSSGLLMALNRLDKHGLV